MTTTRPPLAIVGIGCRFPGGVESAQDFWSLLLSETDATRTVPVTRWNAARFHDPHSGKAGKMVTRRGGFLGDIDQFDAQFFGISPREANLLDPQQRLLLQTTWEAFEDAGIPADALAGTDVGVFIGGFTLDYQLLQNQGRTSRYQFKTHSATGMMMTMLANRISFAFDFRGPSMAVDTACSSSLVAVHLAAQSIWNHECDLAVAGGVNIMIGPNTAIAESKSGFLSPDGRCKAFDESADGYARGEGGAVVVVKPLEQALRDGDEVYAQILGTAVSQDGRTDSITIPSEDAQKAAITMALRAAGIDPDDVGYVEAHGTGTPVGDPVEMRALAGALASRRPADNPLLVGSVKTNIGHLEAGAGVAGLIKTALVLKHGYIPANLHLENPSRQIPFAELNIDVPCTGRPFPASGLRVAGVNSFGFGGTNAHAVLAEPPVAAEAPDPPKRPPLAILPISARSEEALTATARRLAEHLDTRADLTLADLGYNLSQRRSHLSHRRALVVDNLGDARAELEALGAGGGHISAGRAPSPPPKLAFVCTGMGPQWWRMCRGLLGAYPAFTDSITRTDRELSRYAEWSLLEELRRDEAGSRMTETEIAQPANFAVQVALAAQLAAFGVTPDAVIGHSAGEVAAHHLAGLLTYEQAVQVIYHRSRLQQRTSGMGRMLAVGLGAESLTGALSPVTRDQFGRRISVAAINSPFAVAIAGDADVLDDVARELNDAGVFNRFLAGNVPYHTHHMDAVKDDLLGALDGLSSGSAAVPLYSTVTGERLTGYSAGAAYWWQNTRATVLFEAALRRMVDDGYTHFLELGPHPVLATSILEIAGPQKVLVQAAQRRDGDDGRTLMNCVGTLYCNGHDVAWDAVNPRRGARAGKLPTYPWQTKRFWNETREAAEDLHYRPVHPLLGQPVSGVHPSWEVELSVAAIGFLDDHRVQGSVVVPGAVFLEMALAAATELYESRCSVDGLVLHRALILDDTCDPIVRTTLNQDTGTLEFAAFTASADGEVKWTVTATAELNTLPPPPDIEATDRSGCAVSMHGDDFYARTAAIGFDYRDAFRPVREITAGDTWAVADIAVPAAIAGELPRYLFHPALIDGALQTLLGTTFVDGNGGDSMYLPTRIRHSAVYGPPEEGMTASVRVVSATAEEIESDITIADRRGRPLAVLDGFTVASLTASSAMSTEHIDKGLYEIQWVAEPARADEEYEHVDDGQDQSWLVFVDADGLGTAIVEQLRGRGHRVLAVVHEAVDALTESARGYAVDTQRPDHLSALLTAHFDREGDLAGIVNCRPDVSGVLHLVKALAEHDTVKPRLFLVTSNAQPVLGTDLRAVDQAAIWGLGRVIGHQEFTELWGGLIDVDDSDDRAETAARICRHVLDDEHEDQIAIRGRKTLVPRLRRCAGLTKPFPTKLAANATYVVTGGAGSLGRAVAVYLAERGAGHITLLNRSDVPPATVETIQLIERRGARVSCVRVDVTDREQVQNWLGDHAREGGSPIRGIIHAAGSVDDRLLVNMTEADLMKVMAPKVTGTRVLHNVFRGHHLDFFVMFGSAGSVIASPGQGNYAAANAFLDAFAHYRRAKGLPALTIGWGPWSVGMVEELKLEKMYAARGIELITPVAGTRILDRLINQAAASVVAISADWGRARRVGLGGHLPPMFSDLDVETPSDDPESTSVLDVVAATPESGRHAVVSDRIRHIVAAVFDCAVTDVETGQTLDDLGLDSLMAMEFRVRINSMFSIDLPVLEILKGVSVDSLAARVLAELPVAQAPESRAADDDVDRLVDQLSEAELRELLAELEGQLGDGD